AHEAGDLARDIRRPFGGLVDLASELIGQLALGVSVEDLLVETARLEGRVAATISFLHVALLPRSRSVTLALGGRSHAILSRLAPVLRISQRLLAPADQVIDAVRFEPQPLLDLLVAHSLEVLEPQDLSRIVGKRAQVFLETILGALGRHGTVDRGPP